MDIVNTRIFSRIHTILQRTLLITSCGYTLCIVLWWGLHLCYGDTLWWLALVNAFVPYLFLPLLVVVPACFMVKSRMLWCIAGVPVFLFCLLYGPVFLPHFSKVDTAHEQVLTIMTFNILGFRDSEDTAKAILQNGVLPDIVALQEVTPQFIPKILKHTQSELPYSLFAPAEDYKGMGILSRYPLVEHTAPHLADASWQLQTADVIVAGRVIRLYNLHPRAADPFASLRQGQSVSREVQAGFTQRRILFERLMADIQSISTPVVVAGDMNSTDRHEVYTLLTSQLIDAHRAAGWGFGHT
ncbi:MAG: hypothetical protein GY801_45220 [bacterium]|nr:hypothetical protein [bacterium]